MTIYLASRGGERPENKKGVERCKLNGRREKSL